MFISKPKYWLDTLATCAYRSLPLGLDKVGGVLNLAVQKDKRGKYLLNKLSKPQKPTKKNPETRCRDPLLLEELYQYCKTDTIAEDLLGKTIGDLSPEEYSIWVLDQKINTRGVYIDLDAVHKALSIVEIVTKKLLAELQEITGDPEITGGTIDRIKTWCKENGATGLPDLAADTIVDFLKMGWVPANVRRVLEIRQQLSRASTKKLIKFSQCACRDGYIRGLLQYHGAGTGRWSGRLVQPQNFPRGTIKHLEELIAAIKTGDPEILELHFGDPMEAISSALRGMIIAAPGTKFFVADFSAIEARVLMWLAEDAGGLKAFYAQDAGTGSDIYCDMASAVYQRPITKKENPNERGLGKVIILGCGYQMSGSKLLIQSEADLAKVNIKLTPAQAEEYVSLYRDKYTMVPKLWRGLESAAVECVEHGRDTQYLRIKFKLVKDRAGRWLNMILPNGRKLWYFMPGLEENRINYVDKETGEPKTFTKNSLYYFGRSNKKGGAWTKCFTYGGMLTENAVQAISRDLMVAAMWRSERAGYPIVLTVHDEIVAQRKDDSTGNIKEFEAIVAGPNPPWAKGCPVGAEGWEGYRYKK
jgi:DNA polymerase